MTLKELRDYFTAACEDEDEAKHEARFKVKVGATPVYLEIQDIEFVVGSRAHIILE